MKTRMEDYSHNSYKHGGSAGGGGYNYQSQAIAYVSSHILAQTALEWIDYISPDIPISIAVETGGPGDDFCIFLADGTCIEVQARHGLRKSNKFWDAIIKLAKGVATDDELHAVLLVDTTASLTIRTNLRNDLIRMTQGRFDDLKQITLEFLQKLSNCGLETKKIISRIRIVVCDFEQGSPGRTSGRQILSRLIENANTVPVAWDLLIKDGLDLITLRGQRDATTLIRLLTIEGIHLSRASRSPHVLVERYRSWLCKSTAMFNLVGLGIALPIDQAWMKLRTLEKSSRNSSTTPTSLAQVIAQYHEWSRLANTSSSDGASEAEYIAEFNSRVIIIGGPGSGKSTLLRRLAYRYSTEHRITLKVRLPLVCRRMEKMGELFEDAVINVAGDGSGISSHDLHLILSSPHYLLADGLDECDPHRAVIADSLVKWVSGHKEVHVVITTRPIGYAPGAFPEWEHFEILPFSDYEVVDHTRQMISTCCKDNPDRVELEVQLFETRIKNSNAAKLASRSPLLLGFLIQLSMNRIEFGEKRAALHNQILALMQKSPVQDRDVDVQIENVVASQLLDVFGWIVQQNPGITSISLVKKVQELSVGELYTDQLKVGIEAEQALKFWEQRRLIERLSVGGFEVVTFIHLSFCEYVAGRYLAKMPNILAKKWLVQVRRQPQYREIILLAAGSGDVTRIVKWLLDMDNADDPASTEAILAAAAYCEYEGENPGLAEAIAAHLVARLISTIPFVVYEAGNAALPLVPISSTFFGQAVSKLLTHEQAWTRQVAWTLVLQTGKEYVDVNLLDNVYDDLTGVVVPKVEKGFGIVFPSDAESNIQQTFCLKATEVLLDDVLITKTMDQRITRLARTNHLSITTLQALMPMMKNKGLFELGKKLLAEMTGERYWSSIMYDREKWINDDKALLEAIILAFDNGNQSMKQSMSRLSADSSLLSLSALYETMRFGHVIANTYVFTKRHDVESLVTTMRGAAAAMKLQPDDLIAEACYALEQLYSADPPTLISMLHHVHVIPDWAVAKDAGLDRRILARALSHPSEAVAVVAAYLLAFGAGGPEVDDSVQEVLNNGRGNALRMIAAIADDIWGEKALDVILCRLEGELSIGCEHLFKILPHLATCAKEPKMSRVYTCLVRGIKAPFPQTAVKAAEVCAALCLSLVNVAEIQDVYNYWQEHEPPYTDKNGMISHSPRPQLLSILIKCRAFTVDELLLIVSDVRSDVSDVAVDALIDFLSTDVPSVSYVLKKIGSGSAPLRILWKMQNYPKNVFCSAKDEVLNLLISPDPSIRSAAVRSLPKACIDKIEITMLARKMLSDENPEVREQAARMLRRET